MISMEIHTPGDIKREFQKLTQDVKQYLTRQYEIGIDAFPLTQASTKLMNTWGRSVRTPAFRFEGSLTADIAVVDPKGGFFQEAGGRLLKKILNAMTLAPDQVFICNAATLDRIREKMDIGSPRVVIPLGQTAARSILNTGRPLEQLRGRFHEAGSIQVMPTFHPSVLISQPALKRHVWEDMKKVMAQAGLPRHRNSGVKNGGT